ncbi:LacI family DNA-binding transcriptional regulator [Dermatophilaceae bacterium Sec6.4]
MKDVAARAGVSIKTVSRVLAQVPTVDPVIAGRVRDAADGLGFRPNLMASNLRRSDGRTNTIGLLLEDVSNPFSALVHRSVEDYFRSRGVLVLAGSVDQDPDREREMARTLINRRVDGLIVMSSCTEPRYIVAEQQTGTSFVFIDRAPAPLLADAVVADNRVSARTAVAHLLETGRRVVAYFGDDLRIPTADERFSGYQDAMAAAGLDLEEKVIRHGIRTVGQARDATRTMLQTQYPEAVFTSQNLVTIGALEAIHDLGLQDEIALVGFDDIPLAGLIKPGTTVMAQDPVEMGRCAASQLLDRINGDISPPSIHTIPTRLIVRGSGELPRHTSRA